MRIIPTKSEKIANTRTSMDLSLRDRYNVYFPVLTPVYLKALRVVVKGNHLTLLLLNCII